MLTVDGYWHASKTLCMINVHLWMRVYVGFVARQLTRALHVLEVFVNVDSTYMEQGSG